MTWGSYLYFPDGMILLQEEIATGLHTRLESKLANIPSNELELRIACVATHCDVLLDGTYSAEDLDKLCATLAGRLQVLREKPHVEIIIPFTESEKNHDGNSIH